MAWPHQVGVIPRQASAFQQRGAVQDLKQTLTGSDTAMRGHVLSGLGGAGKTQLAAHCARHAQQSGAVDLLVWVDASSRAAVIDRYAQAAADVTGTVHTDTHEAAAAFLAWLEPKADNTAACRWLVVLDDVADPTDLRGLWPPAHPHGRVLATTRRRDAALAGPDFQQIRVGLFTPAQSATYLTARLTAAGRDELPEQVAALADALGHLPLALSQAAAYLVDTALPLEGPAGGDSYRTRLADRAQTLADLTPDVLPDDQSPNRALGAAWLLSLDRADQLTPQGLARPMLHLAAMLHANGIPAAVLTSQPALAHLARHRTTHEPAMDPAPTEATVAEATGALRALHRLSLIDHNPNQPHQTVRVHQLIQRSCRDTLTPDEHEDTARTAADALLAAWPERERTTTLAQSLRAGTTALLHSAEDAMYRPDVHEVVYRCGQSLGESGQAAAACNYYAHLAAAAHRCLGPDHDDTFVARRSLARWQGEAGDAAGAVTVLSTLLEDQLRVLGSDHARILATRGTLAYWCGKAGDAAGAAQILAEVLRDRQRTLGPDHPHTLNTRASLARWQGNAGDMTGAAHALADLLGDRIRVLGPDHPDTLATRRNLHIWRERLRGVAGDVSAFAALLDAMEREAGPDHPDTLIARSDLAHRRGRAGDAAGAVAALSELLEDQLRVLGTNHPDTFATRHRLASWRGEAGDAKGAAEALVELLGDRIRVLGPDHPDTLDTHHALAFRRGMAGDAAGAVPAFTELLAHELRVLGPEHPDTLMTRHNLAHFRGVVGDAAGAAAMLAGLVEDRLRVLGPEHPDTLTSRTFAAHWQGMAGDTTGAARVYAELVPDVERALGPEHPRTRVARRGLVRWRKAAAAMHLNNE